MDKYAELSLKIAKYFNFNTGAFDKKDDILTALLLARKRIIHKAYNKLEAFKRIIPPLGNEFIAMLKDSSLVSVIGFEELTRRGQLIIARTYASFEIWMCVALIYLVMVFIVARFVAVLERKFETK